MKQLGIIRRIDELGRIVIPKELRRTLRIKDGDNLEIYVDDEDIVLKKFSFMNKISDFAQELTDAIYGFVKNNVIITDNDKVIAVSGELKQEYVGKNISDKMDVAIKRRECILEKHIKEINIIENDILEGTYVIHAVIVNGDAVGLVILLSNDNNKVIGDSEQGIAKIAANFLSKYLEE